MPVDHFCGCECLCSVCAAKAMHLQSGCLFWCHAIWRSPLTRGGVRACPGRRYVEELEGSTDLDVLFYGDSIIEEWRCAHGAL